MSHRWAGAGLAVLAAAGHLLFARVPADPVAWRAPAPPGYLGPHAPNARLANLRHIPLGGEQAPEFVRVGPDGWLYASVASGAILRIHPDGTSVEPWVTTGGASSGSTSMPADA